MHKSETTYILFCCFRMTRLADRLLFAGNLGPLYEGPIILVHEHLELAPLSSEWFGWLARLMDEEGISKIVGFLSSQQLKHAKGFESRILPFINEFRWHSPEGALSVLKDAFQKEPSWVGLGELRLGAGIVLWPVHQKYMEAQLDDEALLPIYDLAADHNKVVMVHPRYQPENGNPMDWKTTKAFGTALAHNAKTTFLVHAFPDVASLYWGPGTRSLGRWPEWLLSLIEKYPNWYYDPSGAMNFHSLADPEFFTTVSPTPEGAKAAVQHMYEVGKRKPDYFIREMAQPGHLASHIDRALALWGELFEKKPERCMLGFDLGFAWHWETEVIKSWIHLYRLILGRLPEPIAEQVAYKNA